MTYGKKIISLLTIIFVVLILCANLVACFQNYYPEYQNGYFKYAVKTEGDGTKKAYIIGLTESGLTQTSLVYPEEINGISVYGIGYERQKIMGAEPVGYFKSENLEKFYFPHMPKETEHANTIIIENAYVVYWNLLEDNLAKNRVYGQAKAIFGYNYVEKNYWIQDYISPILGNVSYLYNYDNAPNANYYWVDSYNESIITFVPPDPERDGYIFDGWYKESECINKWDFATDTTGKEIVLEPYKTYDVYEGISLYAKWIEN